MSRVVFGERGDQRILPGISLDRIQSGGRDGPNGEVRWETPGGQTWMYEWLLGTPDEDFQLAIPDIRMPAQQFWPLHWHGCYVAVIILDGTCLCGDWWMKPGDVLIAPADLEYGPAVPGPSGVQMFEVFARSHLRQGGYASEYRDHPTLEGMTAFNFVERSPLNQRNNGRQTLSNQTEGMVVGHLDPGATFDLGPRDDPERGILMYNALAAGEYIDAHSYGDARAVFVLDGDIAFGDRQLGRHDVLIIERDAPVPAITVGAHGARLLEVARTTAGVERRGLSQSAQLTV